MNRVRRIQRRRQIVRRKLMFMALSAVMVVFITGILCGTLFTKARADAAEDPVHFKYYKSIEIQDGDSLWDIASEYMSAEYASVQDYVTEVKEINSLYTNTIYEGQYLTVPYYSDNFM